MAREHFIEGLVKRYNWTAGAEIGLWKGRTYLHLLKTCPQLTLIGVDPWRYWPENANVPGAQTYAGWNMAALKRYVTYEARAYQPRARLLIMTSEEAANLVEPATLDFVFIDANHSEAGVTSDLDAWLPKLKPSGYAIGHDIDWPTVKTVIDRRLPGYQLGPDNLWYRPCQV